MRFYLLLCICSYAVCPVQAQERTIISGKVANFHDKEPIEGVSITLEGTDISVESDTSGTFTFTSSLVGEYVLSISAKDYVEKRISILLEGLSLELGTLYLERDIISEHADNLITLTDAELSDDIDSNSLGLLQATKDVYLNRAAFDFGQAFFRVRGYDSSNGMILLNGIPMNKFSDRRPQWNNWGGLNDITRNQQFSYGLQPSEFNFGGILGTTNIDTRPSGLRPGLRFSSSASNRTYSGRLMATYTSRARKNQGWNYTISGSRRWAGEGYIDGTLYDAFSLFGSVEYRVNHKNSIYATAIVASNRRGRSAAITEEVFDMVGNTYNPNWGEQDGKIRNSRERKIFEPILMLNHSYTSDNLSVNSGLAYQFGTHTRSRLGYYDAPNPLPDYYRYLPSFYINSTIGANFESANTARKGFTDRPQLDWGKLYNANTSSSANGKAAYLLYEDIIEDKQITFNSNGSLKIKEQSTFEFGLTYSRLNSGNFARIKDLLGAKYHVDIDPFSETLNDIDGELEKHTNEVFNYKYTIKASRINTFAQLKIDLNRWNLFFSGQYSHEVYEREGGFKNERFLSSSFGKSETTRFSNYSGKGGVTFRVTGRHIFAANAAYLSEPPILRNIFINPRENNLVVPNIGNQKITSVDINYYLRLPKLTGRFTGFHTRFQDETDINFFFVDSGVGSDFVQEVITDMDKLHLGIEFGLEYQVSPSVTLTAVANMAKYQYANNPLVAINFDTSGAQEGSINEQGNLNLGEANIKGYRLSQGPQQAYAIGLNYRDPKYWWLGLTANYLKDNYAGITTITRTQSFYQDPETGQPFTGISEQEANTLLAQKPLDDFYLLNLVGGKSWLKKGKYVSLFLSINNLFNQVYRTGGYEQSRNGNYEQLRRDNLSGTPSFAPKFWYGYGRTYFLNVAYSF